MKLLPYKEFRYYLTADGVKTELIFAPTDADGDLIGTYTRDRYYGGVMRKTSLPLNFALDAYSILKASFLKYGYAAEVIFDIEQLDHSNFTYKSKFSSQLDFSEWDDNGITTALSMLDSGIFAQIKAQETTDYEYALTGPDIVNVILPGVAFSEKADWITPQQIENISNDYLPALNLVQNETAVGFLTVQQTGNEEDPDLSTSSNWFARANTPLTVQLKGNLQGFASRQPLNSPTVFRIEIYNQFGAVLHTFGFIDAVSLVNEFRFDFDFSLNINSGDRLFIYVRKVNGSPGPNGNYLKFSSDGEFLLSYNSVSTPSNCKGIKIYNLYRRIMARVAPTSQIDSYLLKNEWIKDLVLISGNAIRELSTAVITISFKDFFDACNAWESVGFGVENGVYKIEKLPSFFRPVKMIQETLKVSKCNFTVDVEGVFSSIEIGYNDGNTDDTDGQYEYNSGQEWKMPQSVVSKKQIFVCPIRADQYGIEKLRRDYLKKTNDTSSDNNTFAVHCYLDGDNWRPILGSSYVSVKGMASDLANQTAYNLALTPKENLLRHGALLHSILDKLDGRFIEFGSAEKNKELEFVRPGNPNFRLKQNESIPAASLADKFYKPTVATISAKLPVKFMDLVDKTGGFGWIAFEWMDKVYEGYILDASTDLSKNEEREIKLLLTPNNNY